jgi:hypothetical protein
MKAKIDVLIKNSIIPIGTIGLLSAWWYAGFLVGVVLYTLIVMLLSFINKDSTLRSITCISIGIFVLSWALISTGIVLSDPKVQEFESKFDYSTSCTYVDHNSSDIDAVTSNECIRDYKIEESLDLYLKEKSIVSIGGWSGDYSWVGNQWPYEGTILYKVYLLIP